MMTTLRRLAMVLPMIFIAGAAEAAAQQAQAVTGRVVNAETLQPLSGVLVSVDGANTATLTGQDGRYSIQVPGTGTLIFSMLGYSQRREQVQSRSVIDVGLQSAALVLDEIVAVGYGQQTRATVSGSVSTVTSEQLNPTSFASPSAALAGATQGISVRMMTTGAFGIERVRNSGLANQVVGDPVDGRPGSSAVLQIRNMGNPLFVIDGVPSTSDEFNGLSSVDIENISILKDASAAVYGFRAANGVVLVTTKRGGREQAPRITVTGAYGWQNPTRMHFERMYNAYQHLWNQADSRSNMGQNNNLTEDEKAAGRALLENWRLGGPGFESTNHYALIVQPNAPQYNLNANVSGGSQSAQYYLSVGHVQQDYNLKDFTWGRSNIAANLSVNLSSRFSIGTELRGQNGVTDGVPIIGDTDPVRHTLFSINAPWPEHPVWLDEARQYPNGAARRSDRSPAVNDREHQGYTEDVNRNGSGNFWAQYEFPWGSTLRGNFRVGLDQRNYDMVRKTYEMYRYSDELGYYVDPAAGNLGNRTRQHLIDRTESVFGNLTLRHAQQLGSHSLSGAAFMEMDGSESNMTLLVGQSPTNYTHLIEHARLTGSENDWSITRRASVGGRLNYDYNQKYLVEVLGRYDGSYLYAPKKRWGFFPGVSVAWRLTEEPFLRDRLGFLEDLKIRASYGETAREQGVNAWAYLGGATYNQGNGSVFTDGYVAGTRPRGIPITNLTWVTSVSRNVGLDALLFNGKVSLEADLFDRVLSGIPAPRTDVLLPNEVGYGLPNENLNKDALRGFEMAVTWSDRVGNLSYSISPNFTISRERPLARYRQQYGSSWHRYAATGNNTPVGRWEGVNMAWEAIGQFQSMEEIQNHPVLQDTQDNRNLLPGDLIYKDVNGDGIMNAMDNRPIGFATGITPIVSYGGTTRLGYGGVNLTLNFSGGAYFSHLREFEMRWQGWGDHNGPLYGMDRWKREDPYDPQSQWIPGRYPPIRVNQNSNIFSSFGPASTFWRTNVKFLRVRNVELSYNVPDRLQSIGLSGVRVFTNMSNPFSLDNTRHYNMDPEVVQGNGQVYPTIRLLNIGFSANIGGGQRAAVPVTN